MRKLNRGIAAGVLSLPLVLGVTGAAAADSLEQGNAAAGPDGAAANTVQTNADGSGNAFYEQQRAASHDTSSTTGDHDGLLGIFGF